MILVEISDINNSNTNNGNINSSHNNKLKIQK